MKGCADDSGILHGYSHAAKEGEAALGAIFEKQERGHWDVDKREIEKSKRIRVTLNEIGQSWRATALRKARYKLHAL